MKQTLKSGMKYALTVIMMMTFWFLSTGFTGEDGKTKHEIKTNPPIYIAFLWHMHQPIYWPYESIIQTQQNNRYSFNVIDIHNSRTGPYTSWPKNAVQKGVNANMPHFGAQVSFSGTLIENLNALEANGNGNFINWKSHWNFSKNQNTTLGNPRMDMVAFGYFHPLMGLIDDLDIRKQIQMHKQIFSQNFPGPYSKGMFPPENAFTPRMIPSLAAEGIEWILVDNIHFDRAAQGYPFNTGGNIYEPNKADQLNPNPNDWVQLNGLWAPTRNSARWGRQPHYVEYVDPQTGQKTKIIAVPADRYMGNEDGRGGFGALNYEAVMSQLEQYNTDPQHPILIVLHHDGDNYGGGTDSYYGSNFQNFVNWLQANPSRFVCTTIQDYLEMYPPDPNDVIHIEDGSWSGADNGDPEFKKWLGDPDATGYSHDHNSWGVLTAVKNWVHTANQIDPNNPNTINAFKYLLVGEASDYWYWDGSLGGIWDSHPTRAANQAYNFAQQVTGTDLTPPTVFIPQREPYNPGGTEWGIAQTNNMKVWSYVYDKSGLEYVKLKYRLDLDGQNPMISIQNETYAGGDEVGAWQEIVMTGKTIPSQTNPAPVIKAQEFSAAISGLNDKLVDYYIEAKDNNGNIYMSPIKQVWIGANTGGGGGTGGTVVSWTPTALTKNDTITIKVTNASQGAKLHWGVNNVGNTWTTPDTSYWPAGTVKFNGSGPAVESPFQGPDTSGTLTIKIGPFNNPVQNVDRINFVIHYNDNTWNNNNGQDFLITLGSGGGGGGAAFVMDGQPDATAQIVATNNGVNLYLGWNGSDLYVATQSAQSQGKDVFIFVADSVRGMVSAPWAKSGQVGGYSAYLANESTNNYVTWGDASGATLKAAGQILEGSINLQQEFGFIPATVKIAVGQYQTADQGVLQGQVPSGNSNGDIEAGEYFVFDFVLSSLKEEMLVPVKAELSQNYPNPFNPATVISYFIPEPGEVSLRIYDVLGNQVAVLADGYKTMGYHTAEFNPAQLELSSGMYIYTLRSGNSLLSRKMMYVK